MELLTEKARHVVERVIAREQAERSHIVIALSGAHAYGFPSPDSDLDLKAIHVEPTRNLLGLSLTRNAFDCLEIIDGVEIDYTSNEIHGALNGIIAGNGNYIERVMGSLILHSTPEHEELRELVPTVLSRRVYRHYRGFAASQRKAFEQADEPTVKRLLYVLRTALTGTHLLRKGELRVDLTTVADEYGCGDANALIEAKKRGERTVLDADEKQAWQSRLDGLFALLDEAHEASPLPEEPPSTEELEDWLIAQRLAAFCDEQK